MANGVQGEQSTRQQGWQDEPSTGCQAQLRLCTMVLRWQVVAWGLRQHSLMVEVEAWRPRQLAEIAENPGHLVSTSAATTTKECQLHNGQKGRDGGVKEPPPACGQNS